MEYTSNLTPKLNNDESKYNETKCDDETKSIKNKKQKPFGLKNKQKILISNYKETTISNPELVLKNIYSTDDDIYSQIYSQISNPYQKKLNIITMLLKSDLVIPLSTHIDVIKFFNWLSPLNNEFGMSSKDWEIKTIKYGNREKILLHNSISKQDMGRTFYSNYIDVVKKKLSLSNVPYCYFEFKSKRFNKIKDIIWAFDKN